jgi:hypothetical protein
MLHTGTVTVFLYFIGVDLHELCQTACMQHMQKSVACMHHFTPKRSRFKRDSCRVGAVKRTLAAAATALLGFSACSMHAGCIYFINIRYTTWNLIQKSMCIPLSTECNAGIRLTD